MTPTDSTLMSKECNQIPEVVANQIRQNERIMAQLCQRITEFAPQYVVTIARGSSDNAANYAKYLFESQLGWVTASASPSIVTLYQKYISTFGISKSLFRPTRLSVLASVRPFIRECVTKIFFRLNCLGITP